MGYLDPLGVRVGLRESLTENDFERRPLLALCVETRGPWTAHCRRMTTLVRKTGLADNLQEELLLSSSYRLQNDFL